MAQPLIPFEQIGCRRTGLRKGGRQQLYFLDDSSRRLILALYDGTSERIEELMRRLSVPRWRIKRWACEMGLSRPQVRQPNWTEQEVRYLEANLGRIGLERMAATLGRTKIAVQVKAKRIGINQRENGYTMHSLGVALGCDHHRIERWIKSGWIIGHRREAREYNDYWYFSEQQVRDFVITHPNEIDPRRMDWLWLVDLLTGGLGSLSEIDQQRPKVENGMHLDIDNELIFNVDELAGNNIAILGITRSGKTNTALVIIEELFSNHVPMTIVDIESEYRSLKDRFDLLVTEWSKEAEIPLTIDTAEEIATMSIEQNRSVLLDLSSFTESDAHAILHKYFARIWKLTAKRKEPYQIILEEAHEWIPEGKKTQLKEQIIRIALRGRKRGLGLMLISQRSAKISKDALSQCNVLFLHKVIHPADRGVYKSLVPLQGTEVERMIGDLQTGHAIIVNEKRAPQIVGMRQHGGKVIQPDIKTVLRKRIKELEDLCTEQESTIKEQADYIALLTEQRPERVLTVEREQLCI